MDADYPSNPQFLIANLTLKCSVINESILNVIKINKVMLLMI